MNRSASIPRCCPAHRDAWIAVVDNIIANDAFAAIDGWTAAGTPEDEAIADFRAWMVERVDDAIEFGVGLRRLLLGDGAQ